MKSHWIVATTAAVLLNLLAMFSSPVAAQGAIAPGETLTGAISPAGDFDAWTFSATAGDAIIVRVGEITQSGSFSPRIRLFDPSAVLLSTQSTTIAAEIAVTAAATGVFTIVVDDLAGVSATGTYRLSLAKTGSAVTVSPGDEGGPLTNGAMHTGIIDVGDLDVWTVTANAGDRIVVRMGETVAASPLTPYLRIYSPAGVLLDSSTTTIGAEVEVTAGSAGTYLVVAADLSASFAGSGSYRLTLAKTGSAVTVSAGDEGGPLTNGAVHTGTLDVGDLDVWTVTANAGDGIVVRMGETVAGSALTPWLRIYSPSGTLLDSSTTTIGAEVEVTAGSSGTYLVVAADLSASFAGSGSYRLTLATTGSAVTVSPGDEGGPLTNGAVHTGTLDVGDLDVWTVTANAGDGIVVRMGETVAGSPLTPWLRIYSPAGVLLASNTTTIGAEVAVTAGSSGTYVVVAADLSASFAGSGSYRLTLATTGSAVTVSPGDEGGPLTNGAMHTGFLEVGDLDVWTVHANVGERIVVRMGETVAAGSLSPWLRIYSPSGALLDSVTTTVGAEVAVTAASFGQYLVIAGDLSASFSGSGAYRLTLAKTATPVVVSVGDEGGPLPNGVSNGFLDVGDLDVWTLGATAGNALVVTMTEVTGPLTPWLRIYSPSGVLVGTVSGAASAQVSVPSAVSGIYLVVAGDLSASYSGSGAYTLTTSGATGFNPPVLDIDASGAPTKYDPFTDGLLVLRYLFELSGDPLVAGALGGTATRKDPTTLQIYLDSIRAALDVDGNNVADALTDGLLIIRYMMGLRGAALITGAFDPAAPRTTALTIEPYIQGLMPP